MNNNKYTYPIGKLFRFVILLEIMWWFLLGIVFLVIKWIDFKKEWAKQFIPLEAEESAKRLANEFINAELTPSVLHPNYAWLLLIIPVIWIVEGQFMQWKNKRISAYPEKTIKTLMLKELNLKVIKWRYFWLRTALLFVIIGLMQPVFGTRKAVSNQRNQEIVLCLDISNSMNVKDLSSVDSRLDIAKRGIINFINTLRGERVGLCVFAGTAQIQLPITTDYHATKMFVNEIQTDIISKQGTNVNEALLISSKMFTKSKNTKITMMITDGEDHIGNLSEGEKAVKEKNIKLAVFGIGSNQGGYVPNDPLHPEFGYKILPTGKRVISKLNKKLLVDIAQQTGGTAIVINSVYPDFQSTVSRYVTLSDTENSVETEMKVKQNFYPVFMGIGLLLFCAYLFYPFFKVKVESRK
jgi:Ca-activated chloride channel family protein